MSKVIVKWDGNWADEIDYDGFCIYDSKEEWEQVLVNAKKCVRESPGEELYFGTNEYITVENESELDSYTVTDITNNEAEIIRRLVGDSGGMIDPFTRLAEQS